MTSIIEKLKILSQSNSRKLDAIFFFVVLGFFLNILVSYATIKMKNPKFQFNATVICDKTCHVITRVCFVCLFIIPVLVIKCLKMYVNGIYIPVIFLYYYLKLLNNTWFFLDGYIVNMPVTCYILSHNFYLLIYCCSPCFQCTRYMWKCFSLKMNIFSQFNEAFNVHVKLFETNI